MPGALAPSAAVPEVVSVVSTLPDLLARTPSAVLVALGIALMVVLALVLMVRTERRRRRAEAAERVVAGQLRTITASMREGVIAYDMDLQLTFVNPAFERLTG